LATRTEPPELVNAERASVWVRWYFSRGALTIITMPLFLFLLYAIIVSILGAITQFLALAKVSWAVLGTFGVLIVVCGGWIPIIIPPVLYYSLVKNLPGLWIRSGPSWKAKMTWSVVVLVAFPLSAFLIYHGITWGIGWIADRDPCAAFAAGVTGSTLPTNCP